MLMLDDGTNSSLYLVNVISLIPTTSTSIQFMSFSTSRGNSSLALKQKIAKSKYKILQSVTFQTKMW